MSSIYPNREIRDRELCCFVRCISQAICDHNFFFTSRTFIIEQNCLSRTDLAPSDLTVKPSSICLWERKDHCVLPNMCRIYEDYNRKFDPRVEVSFALEYNK